MNFDWDEVKRQNNLRKHGLDFHDAKEMFDYPMITELDTRYDYGEERWVGIGISKNRILVVVFTEDDETNRVRIISLRKALRYERKFYEESIAY